MSARRPRGPERRSAADLRRLLNRLARGATLIDTGKGSFRLEEGGRVLDMSISHGVIEACRAADLLETKGPGLVLSDMGHARIRRHGAEGREPFRAQHQHQTHGVREIGGVRQSVLLNDGESPLGWLRSRKDRCGRPLIGEEQFEAGERLRADYWFVQMSPRVTADWSAAAGSTRSRRGAPADAAGMRDEVFAAKDRVTRALTAVGPETSGILVDICCELKGLEEAEKENGWPQRAAKVVLQIALTRLAKHYGLITDAPDRGRRLCHWGQAGYRPRIDGAPEEPDRA